MTAPTDADVLAALRVLRAWLVGDAPVPAAHYDSRHLPAGIVSARSYRDRARKMAGARRVGRDWVISAEAWNAAIASPAPKQSAPPSRGDSVEEILAAKGTRLKAR